MYLFAIKFSLSYTPSSVICLPPFTDLQCWEADQSLQNPKIRGFDGVKKISGGGLNRRRLIHSNDDQRRLQSATFEISCVLSETDLIGTQDILIDYQKCKLPDGIFEIGLTKAVGTGVITFSSSLVTATVLFPSPIQDPLTTFVKDCNAEW